MPPGSIRCITPLWAGARLPTITATTPISQARRRMRKRGNMRKRRSVRKVEAPSLSSEFWVGRRTTKTGGSEPHARHSCPALRLPDRSVRCESAAARGGVVTEAELRFEFLAFGLDNKSDHLKPTRTLLN